MCEKSKGYFQKGYTPWNKGKTGVYSKETKVKMSLAHKGRKFSEEHKNNIREVMMGNKHCLGRKHSQETIEKMRKAQTGIKMSESAKEKMRQSKTLFKTGIEHPFWKGGISLTKEGRRVYDKAKYARRKKAGQLSIKTIQLVYEDNIKQYGTLTCYLCLQPIKFSNDSLEHKMPVIRGGTNEYNNLAVACRSCNSKKNTKTVAEYLQKENEKNAQ